MIFDDIDNLRSWLANRKILKDNPKVTLVTGGFDLLTSGHVRYIKKASHLGNILIVGVNSDSYIESKRGYVITPLQNRLEIIDAIKGVDAVIETENVAQLIKQVEPTFFANGGDRTSENCSREESVACEEVGCYEVFGVGGGKTTSTSWIVERIKEHESKRST